MPVPLPSVITIPEAVFTLRLFAMIITHAPLILVIVMLVVNILNVIAILQMLVLSPLVTALQVAHILLSFVTIPMRALIHHVIPTKDVFTFHMSVMTTTYVPLIHVM
jgi:hypothetical protein